MARKDPGVRPDDYFKDVPGWNSNKRAAQRRNRRADNSPSYDPNHKVEYETVFSTAGNRKVRKRTIPKASRYILRTSSTGGATGTSGQSTRKTVKSSWEEVPLNYIPAQGEVVYQGPSGKTPDPKNPQFHRIPSGSFKKTGIQLPPPDSTPGKPGGYRPGISRPEQVYGGSANAAEGGYKPSRNPSNVRGGSTYDSQVPREAGLAAGAGGTGTGAYPSPTGPGTGLPDEVLAALDELARGSGLEIGWDPGKPVQVNLPAFPKAPDFKFKRNDFSDEANAAMAKAYGPRYAAIDAAKQSVVEQQARSDEIVKGIFNQLYADLDAGEGRTKSRYDAAAQNAADSGAATARTIREGAANSNSDMVAELRAMGLSPQEIAQNLGRTSEVTDQSAAAALTAGQANQQNMAAQGLSATDFAGTMATAAKNQGAVSREQIAADAAQAIQGYSNQALDIAGQQSAQAIDYGQAMSEQDMSLQQMQYGVLSDRYQGDVGQYNALANQAFQNADLTMQDRGMRQSQNQFEVQALMAQEQDFKDRAAKVYEMYQAGQISQQDALLEQMKMQEEKRQWDAEHALDLERLGLDREGLGLERDIAANEIVEEDRRQTEIEREGLEPEGGSASEMPTAEGLAEFASKATAITGPDPAELQKYYSIFINEMNQNGTFGAVAEPAFITQMTTKYANAPGINPIVLGQVASLFHRIMYKGPAAAIQG